MSVRKQGAKEHHTVPRCYLKSWADVETPTDQTPYLWVVDLNSGRVIRRAPKNTFVENDFYVIKGKGGIRDLRLEKGLSGLEASFDRIRREVLERRGVLQADQVVELAAFVAAMKFRTKPVRDHLRSQLQKIIDDATRFEGWLKNAPKETVDRLAAVSRVTRPSRRGVTIDELKIAAEAPMAVVLPAGVEVWTTALANMAMSVLCAGGNDTFITSDNPCVLIDLSRPQPRPLYPPTIFDKNVQLTLPVSPRLAIAYSHKKSAPSYIDAPTDFVSVLNSRTATYAGGEYVASTKVVAEEWRDKYLTAKAQRNDPTLSD
jgi:hypothetical protein